MVRISDPMQIDHERLRELALMAAWVAKVWEEGEKGLAERLAAWLGEDPEHWSIPRLMLLDPLQEPPGQWYEDAPAWLRILGEIAGKEKGIPSPRLHHREPPC